jgi:hypothetical protein
MNTLAACAGVSASTGVSVGGAESGLEEIYSATVDDFGLRIRVASNGCTSKDSFDFTVAEVASDGGAPRHLVSFVRTRPDPCPGFRTQGDLLTFSFDELRVPEGAELAVANPLGPTRRNP